MLQNDRPLLSQMQIFLGKFLWPFNRHGIDAVSLGSLPQVSTVIEVQTEGTLWAYTIG